MDQAFAQLSTIVPTCLQAQSQWVVWKYIDRDGKQTKAPFNATSGGFANSTDPKTWTTFELACDALSRDKTLAGVGFVFSADDPYCGIDLDNCRDPITRELKPWALVFVQQLSSYTEISPSGTGVKVFVKAAKPGKRCRKAYLDGEVEIYDAGRFFTVTGDRLEGSSSRIEERQSELDRVYGEVFGHEEITPASTSNLVNGKSSINGHVTLGDTEIIELATKQRRTGEKFRALWEGNWNAHFNSASEADSSIVFTFAFYTKNPRQIDRLFRRSGLMRPKWDDPHGEQSYGELTIAKALDKVTKHYEPKRGRRTRPAAPPPTRPTLPSIVIDDLQLADLTNQAMAALVKSNAPEVVFVRAGTLARVVRDEEGLPRIEPLDSTRVRNRLSEVANFFTLRRVAGEFEPVGTYPPKCLAENVLAQTTWDLPPLAGIARAPILRSDGTICTTAGYDRSTRLLYCPDPTLRLPSIPEFPCGEEVRACVDILLSVLGDFPFIDAASRANALGILFSTLMRPVISGHVPLAIVDAPMQGTGKTLMVTTLATIAVGNVAAESIPARQNEEEWRKKITSILMTSSPFVMLENIPDNTTIDSASLAAALTSREWSDRLLGGNNTVRLPSRSVWVATGNNLRVAGDIPRRSYGIRLDANVERPWERTGFTIQGLEQHVRSRRGDLLSAALTIVRAWYTNGRPRAAVPTLGSFEEWAETIGSVLAFADVEGFLTNLKQTQVVQDEDTQQWIAFFEAWAEVFGDQAIMADDICRLVLTRKDLFDASLCDALIESLPEPLLVNRDKGEGAFKRSIGRHLARLTGRVFSGRKLSDAGVDTKRRVRRWKLEMCGAGPSASVSGGAGQ